MLEAGARMVLDKKIHVDALYAAIRSVVNRATVG
jgi:DNA-binding NarL/FixJ family response regulator